MNKKSLCFKVNNVSYSHEEIRINIPTRSTPHLKHKNSRSQEPESSSESKADITKPEHVISNGSKGIYDRPRINKMRASSYTDGPTPSSPDYDTPRSQLYKVLPALTPKTEENAVPDIKLTLATLSNESDNNSEMDAENNDEIPPSYENCSPLKSIREEKPLLVASGKYKRHTRGNERYKTHTCVISRTDHDENGDAKKCAPYETLDKSVTLESQRANPKPVGKRLKSSKTIGNVNDLDTCKDYVNLKEAIDDLSDNIYENCKRNLRSPGKTDHNKGSDSSLKPTHGERHIPSQKKKTPPAKLPKTFKNFKPNGTDPDTSKTAFIKNEASDQNNSGTNVEYENVSHLKMKKSPVSVRNKASSDKDANMLQSNSAESNTNNATGSNIFNKSDKKPKVESPLLTSSSKALLTKSKTATKDENNGSDSKDYENIEKIEHATCDDKNNDKVNRTENAQEDLKDDNDESEFCKTKLQQSDSIYEEPDAIGSLKMPQSDDTYYTSMKAGVHNFDLVKDLVQDDMRTPMSVLESTDQQTLLSHTSTDLEPPTSCDSTENEDYPAPPPPCSGNYANLSKYVNVVHQ